MSNEIKGRDATGKWNAVKVEDGAIKTTASGGATATGGNNSLANGTILYGIEYDAIDVDESGATTDVFTYYTGGLAGTVVATVTVTYTDNTKEIQDTIVRTTP